MDAVFQHEKVTVETKVNSDYYSSPSNFLYEVNGASNSANPYLLFNPSIHYWVALDNLGAEVIRSLNDNRNLSELKKELINRCSIDEAEFVTEVKPLLDQLVELKFLYLVNPPEDRNWSRTDLTFEDPSHYPFEDIIISLSDRCNLACTYCFNAGSRNQRLVKAKELKRVDRKTLQRFYKDFKDKGGTGVVFTGGEPTLNPELLEFCEDAKASGLKVSIITNGTRLKDLDVNKLINVVDALHVSIDSFDPEVNAELWGVGARIAQQDILSELVKIGTRAKELGEEIRLVLKPTVTRRNKDLLNDMFIEGSRRLSEFDFGFDITIYEPTENESVSADLTISPSEFQTSLKNAFRDSLKNMNPDLKESIVENQAELFALTNAGKAAASDKPTSFSCVPSLFITNSGDVFPCQAFEIEEFKLGNVFENSINDFFNQRNFKDLRSHMTRDHIEVCKACELRFICVEHCHGESFKEFGRTTAFGKPDTDNCRAKLIRRLWLETQEKGSFHEAT